jgi:predicted phage terminase large subunit-like protein
MTTHKFKTQAEIDEQEKLLRITKFKGKDKDWLATRKWIHQNPKKAKEAFRALANQNPIFLDVLHDFDLWCRSEQFIEMGDKSTTLVLCGRAYGKTHFSSNFAIDYCLKNEGSRVACWAADYGSAKRVNFLSDAGIIKNLHPNLLKQVEFNKSDLTLRFPNGSTIVTYSGEAFEKSRGDSVNLNIIDELAAYAYAKEALDAARLIARLGENPQTLILTTPRPTATIVSLAKDENVNLIKGTSYDNYYVSESYIEDLARNLTERTFRQEVLAEILDDNLYALFQMSSIIDARVNEIDYENIKRIVISVDPAVSSDENSDLTGIVVCAQDYDGHYYVIEDASMAQASPEQWSSKVVSLYRKYNKLGNTSIVAEKNQGGSMISSVIKNASRMQKDIVLPPVRLVHASKGKEIRAEPVAALYEQGLVHHLNELEHLESEMTEWNPTEKNSKSPDRMDAMVWGVTELMKSGGGSITSGYGIPRTDDEESPKENIYSSYY